MDKRKEHSLRVAKFTSVVCIASKVHYDRLPPLQVEKREEVVKKAEEHVKKAEEQATGASAEAELLSLRCLFGKRNGSRRCLAHLFGRAGTGTDLGSEEAEFFFLRLLPPTRTSHRDRLFPRFLFYVHWGIFVLYISQICSFGNAEHEHQ